MNNIKKQVDALLEQEKKLARKLEVVREVIGKRTNPHKVFKYIADNIPEGVWLTSLELNGRDISFQGYSKDYQKIGDFIDSLKNSIFFHKGVSYERPKACPRKSMASMWRSFYQSKGGEFRMKDLLIKNIHWFIVALCRE